MKNQTSFLNKNSRRNDLLYIKTMEWLYSCILWFFAGGVFFMFRFYGEGLSDARYVKNIYSFFLLWIISSIVVGSLFLWVNSKMDRLKFFSKINYFSRVLIRTAAMFCIGVVDVSIVSIVAAIINKTSFLLEFQLLIINNPVALKFFVLLLYASFIYSALFQFHRIFGIRMALQVISGYYRTPRQGEFIFMFVDLNDFTTITEQIGHRKIALLLNDCFGLLAQDISKYNGSIYSYVGDAVIVYWDVHEGIKNNNYIQAVVQFMEKIEKKQEYFMHRYGMVPKFKVGVSMGEATGYEVGASNKKEIIYLGDVLNTSSRLLSIQKSLGLNPEEYQIFISGSLKEATNTIPNNLLFEDLGKRELKGKEHDISVFALKKQKIS